MKTDLVSVIARKQARLKALLDEAWALESELNALHRQLNDPPAASTPAKAMVTSGMTSKDTVTALRIQLALMKGPLLKRGEIQRSSLLVERCEDIPGANKDIVRKVLRSLVAKGFIRRKGDQFWRAA